MGTIYVARSAALGKWASDVGLSKHIYKLGYTEEEAKPFVAAAGWCGETDWTLVKAKPVEAADETALIERLKAKEKMIEPGLYPKLKGTPGVFKVVPQHVESHLVIARALEGDSITAVLKLKPADFATYLINSVAP